MREQREHEFKAIEISLGGESECERLAKSTLLLERTRMYTDRPLTGLIYIIPLVCVGVATATHTGTLSE